MTRRKTMCKTIRNLTFGLLIATATASASLADHANRDHADERAAIGWRAIETNAAPYALRADTEPGQHCEFERIDHLSTLVLSSDDEGFGGFSSFILDAAGGRILALSDRGFWLRAQLKLNEDGAASGISDASIAPMTDHKGEPFPTAWSDAESLVLDKGKLLVSFERHHRIDQFKIDTETSAIVFDKAYADLSEQKLGANKGIEGFVRLDAKRIFAIAEGVKRDGSGARAKGFLISDDGKAEHLTYEIDDGFAVTEITKLDDKRLLVVERAFSMAKGVRLRLKTLKRKDVKAGAHLVGDELLYLDRTHLIDNIEAAAVRADADGGLYIYLMSDDNYSEAQRTLLMSFKLKD